MPVGEMHGRMLLANTIVNDTNPPPSIDIYLTLATHDTRYTC